MTAVFKNFRLFSYKCTRGVQKVSGFAPHTWSGCDCLMMHWIPCKMARLSSECRNRLYASLNVKMFANSICLTGRKWSWTQSISSQNLLRTTDFRIGLKQHKYLERLKSAFPHEIPSRTTVCDCFSYFCWSRRSLEDEDRSGVHQRWANLCSGCHGKTDPAQPSCERSFKTRSVPDGRHTNWHTSRKIPQ